MQEPTSTPTPAVRAVVLDFDGTVCPEDVSDRLFDAFAPSFWRDLDREYERGEIGSRENLLRLIPLLGGSRDEMLAWVLENHAVDPTFPPFVRWARDAGIHLSVVSDGIGLHIEPILHAASVEGLDVRSNFLVLDGGPPVLRSPAAHPICVTCGTCKMQAVRDARERHGAVAFVGDGHSDRYGALYADLVFGKRALADLCGSHGIPFLEWETFEDVRAALERLAPGDLPGPVSPDVCPGWSAPGGTAPRRTPSD